MITYYLLKTIHIGSLILWLGPALGSWLVLRYAQKNDGESADSTSLIYRVFFFTVTLEHIAFIGLILSGIGMAIISDAWSTTWLSQKLWLVGLIIIPLEAVDIWLGNWMAKRIIEKRQRGLSLSAKENFLLKHYHTTFTYLALYVLPITVLAIMWLAISKAGLY